ncbi:MAG: NADP transhydrogenase subunit alpha [Verrucomicrobia bacterium]|nr:NADP transhydrogenase subunit alpha [Verrucomicrobiota bacterium]
MTRIAIIGTGIAGLGCAHFLESRFDLTLFERNDYPGGHTNTVSVEEPGRAVPIDTGFMVFNEVTYPRLTRLFRELGVATKATSMSFSVQHVPSGLEFCGSSVNHLFAQRRNLLRPRYWRMLRQINRFNGEAAVALDDPAFANHTLGRYVAERGYGDDFLNFYLVPMSAAVWSTPPERMLEFPATTLLRFFHNHGFLGLHTQHPWRTVSGGAKTYVEKIVAPLRKRVRLRSTVVRVERLANGARVTTTDGRSEDFDKVILACHADQSLRLLADADVPERALLGEFQYQKNLATLHTDGSVMPRARLAWASWNYRIEHGAAGRVAPSTIYWMNSLQSVSEHENYFVSINAPGLIAPERVLRRIEYEHPLFNLGAIRAQAELPKLNQRSPSQAVYFCGSYFKHGFHEDALASALDLCRALTGERIWT